MNSRTTLILIACLAPLLALGGTKAAASDRPKCRATSPLWYDVRAGGNSFQAYSNIARSIESGASCMQWILRNDPDRAAVRVEWYYREGERTKHIIKKTKIAGCFDSGLCDCKVNHCQVFKETSPRITEPKPVETTVDFGLYLRDPPTRNDPEFSDDSVRARILPPPHTRKAPPKLRERASNAGAPPTFLPPEDWQYPELITHIGGFPSTSNGKVVSVDLTFVSHVIPKSKNEFSISYNVLGNLKNGNVFLASVEGTRAGKLSIKSGDVAVAWSAFDALSPQLFSEPSTAFRLAELADRVKPQFVSAVGISDETNVLVYYDGEVVLEAPVAAYLPLANR
jgi:hypothetical protein